jgi:hypothetical protein
MQGLSARQVEFLGGFSFLRLFSNFLKFDLARNHFMRAHENRRFRRF